jgi:hypothetical protein
MNRPVKKHHRLIARLACSACFAATLALMHASYARADDAPAAKTAGAAAESPKPADAAKPAEPPKAKDVVEYETRASTGKPPASDPKTDVPVKTDTPTTLPGTVKSAATQASAAMKNREEGEHYRQRQARLAAAVEHLKKEANDMDDFDKVTDPPYFQRPHPALAQWNPDMALDTLRRMTQPFTGNEYRDTYIRWHLMEVIKHGTQEDKEEMGKALIKLISIMPDELHAVEKPDHRFEPPDIAARFHSLWNSQVRTIGYPPFQRQVVAPEVYKYVSADEAAQIQKNLAEAETLRDKFKTIIDIGARQWNERIRQINWFIRQYRGELIYAVLQTGDPEMFKLVMATIDRHARRKSGIAMDLLTYMYLAAFDGVLNLYTPEVLLEGSKQLEASARAMEGFQNYGGYVRNFGDYAFHMIYILRDGGGFVDIKEVQNMPTRKRRL